jgi:hypothetical protein
MQTNPLLARQRSLALLLLRQDVTGAATALLWPRWPPGCVAVVKVMSVPPCPSLAATNSLAM